MDDLIIWYEITCHTNGCKHQDITIRGPGPSGTAFMCGPCGVMVDDWKVSEDQTDGN